MLLDPNLVKEALAYPERVVTVSSRRKLVQCPRRFRYDHSDRRIEDNSTALKIGSRWHSVYEALLRGQEHPENHLTLRHWVQGWDDLQAVMSPEQPFLFPWKDYLIGGVIDLIAKDKEGAVWAVDHKISTGQFLTHQPPIQITEQLGVYVAALRYYNVTPVTGGVVSRLKITKDLTGELAKGLLVGEGGTLPTETPAEWGYRRIESGRITQAVLYGDKTALRVEREFFEITPEMTKNIVDDLVQAWYTLYDRDFRVPSSQCLYCSYAKDCDEERGLGIPAPAVDIARLHPEFFRLLREAKE